MDLAMDWVVGFVDGVGHFLVHVEPDPQSEVSYRVRPEFLVVRHERDVQVLYGLKRFFRCGVVRRRGNNEYVFSIQKFHCLQQVVAFFERHGLKTKKNVDFKKFARIVHWMENERHLTREGLVDIVKLATTMSECDQERLQEILDALKQQAG